MAKKVSVEKVSKFNVEILVPTLNVRFIASCESPVVTTVRQGETVVIDEELNGFGHLASGEGWIMLTDETVRR